MVIYEDGKIDLFASPCEITACREIIADHAESIRDSDIRHDALQCAAQISIPLRELRHLTAMLDAAQDRCCENIRLDRDRFLYLTIALGPEIMRESSRSLAGAVRACTGSDVFEAEYTDLLSLELGLRKESSPRSLPVSQVLRNTCA